MATLTIRNIDDTVKDRLRIRAAQHRRSLEAELRAIVTEAVAEPAEELDLADAIRRRFAPFGGVDDLVLPPRALAEEPPALEP